jgi:DHA1 family tetracycline resistance protein-like MFS transporter
MTAASRSPGSSAFGFLIVTITIDMIAGGMIIPIFPSLVQALAGGDAVTGARMLGYFITAWAAMQVIFSPILGSLSDHYGRRPVLLVSLGGLALSSAMLALAPNLAWLLVARLVSGAAASTMAVGNAYIADVTAPSERARRFGYLSAAWGVGFVLGPALGGLAGGLSPRAPMWIAAGLAAANTVWGFFALPESLSTAHRAPFTFAKANPFGAVSFFWSRPGFLALGAVIFLSALASQVLGSASIPYSMHRYHWSTTIVGLSMAIVGAGYVVVQSFIVGPFVKRFGEMAAIYFGLVVVVLAYLVYALSPWGWLFLAGHGLFVLGGLQQPGMQALMSRQLPPEEQGRLQGARAGLMAIAQLIGPIVFTELYARSIGVWSGWSPPGLIWFLSASLLVGAVAMARLAAAGPVPHAAVGMEPLQEGGG